MADIRTLTQQLLRFREERDWQQFHKPKDIALSLMLEAAELLELFQWKNDAQVAEYLAQNPEKLRDELADVFNWVLLLAHDAKIDIAAAAEEKIRKNAAKYPVDKAKGRATKHTEF